MISRQKLNLSTCILLAFSLCILLLHFYGHPKKKWKEILCLRERKKRNETDYSRCSQSLDREGSDRSRQARRPERREAEESEKLKNHQSAQAGFLHVINMAESPSNIRGTSLNVRPAAEQLFFLLLFMIENASNAALPDRLVPCAELRAAFDREN
jgi:hypothetical protein